MVLFLEGLPSCANQSRAVDRPQIELGGLEEDHQRLLRLLEELLEGPHFEAWTSRLEEIQGELERQGLILDELESILKSPGPAGAQLPMGFVEFDSSSADSLTVAQTHYTAAAQEFSRGSYDEAIRSFREFIRVNTDNLSLCNKGR